ncbi:MAG: cell division protein ZapA [Bacillota bacterium]
MTEERKINVLIDGRNFTVVGAEDERYVRELAAYVDSGIKKMSSKNERLSPTMAATLTAFNIADELFKVQEEHKSLKKKSKEPLEKYDSLKKEVEDANKKIREMESKSLQYQDEVIKTKLSKEELFGEINGLKESIIKKDDDIHKCQENLKGYKEKHFKTQMEIVELRKQLKETIELLDK